MNMRDDDDRSVADRVHDREDEWADGGRVTTEVVDGRHRPRTERLEGFTPHADDRDRRILELSKALGERDRELDVLSQKIRRREQQVVALKEELRRQGLRLGHFRDEALELSNVRGHLRALEKSRSWRLTSPLRALLQVGRRLRHLFHPEASPGVPNRGAESRKRKRESVDAPLRRLFPPNQIYPMRSPPREPLAVSDHPPEVRAIAFYLPQYHTVPENDAWWGEGFTDWTNVRRARPLFTNHDLPRIPSELGFYDLRVKETIERQASLIRSAGLEGACIYYYWFNGKRLLDEPLELNLRERGHRPPVLSVLGK